MEHRNKATEIKSHLIISTGIVLCIKHVKPNSREYLGNSDMAYLKVKISISRSKGERSIPTLCFSGDGGTFRLVADSGKCCTGSTLTTSAWKEVGQGQGQNLEQIKLVSMTVSQWIPPDNKNITLVVIKRYSRFYLVLPASMIYPR